MITIPTLSTLYTSILNDLETEMGNNIPAFGKVYLRAQAAVDAGLIWLLYKGLGKVQKNIFIDTADPESSGGTLERFGRVKLNRNPYPAQPGQYQLTVTGQNAATIPAQTIYKSNDDAINPGKLYVLDIPFVFSGTSGTITVRSLEAGVANKLAIADGLTATSPIPNVSSAALVLSEVDAPLEAEDIEAYRQKGIDGYQLEPNGGAPSDFRLWAKGDVQGVRQVYSYAKTGFPGEVNVFVEAELVDSTDGMGTPSGSMLLEVEDVINQDPDNTKPIDERGRRPIGMVVHVLPVAIKQIDIQIEDFEGLTPAIETSIFNALKADLYTTRPFIAGADAIENKKDIYDINKIISIVLTVRPGSTFGEVNLFVDGVEVNTYTFIEGQIPNLATVTYP